MYSHVHMSMSCRICVIRWRRLVGSLIFIDHFLPKWPIFSGSFVKNDLQLRRSYESSPPCILHMYGIVVHHIWMCCVAHLWTSPVMYINMSCHMYKFDMTYLRMSHGTNITEYCITCECVKSHVYQWVLYCIWICRVTHTNQTYVLMSHGTYSHGTYVTWLIHTPDMTHSNMVHGSVRAMFFFPCLPLLIGAKDRLHKIMERMSHGIHVKNTHRKFTRKKHRGNESWHTHHSSVCSFFF